MGKQKSKIIHNWHRTVLMAVLCLFGFCLLSARAAPNKKKKRRKTDERV